MIVGMEGTPQARLPERRSIRLLGFDYGTSAGYVVTICAYRRRPLFAVIRNGVAELTALGRLVEEEWLRTPGIRSAVLLDEYVIMPNHFHGILVLNGHGGGVPGAIGESGPSHTLSAILRGFKGACTSRARREGLGGDVSIWQRGFFERVIRDEDELCKFRRYIANNPQQWELDRFHLR